MINIFAGWIDEYMGMCIDKWLINKKNEIDKYIDGLMKGSSMDMWMAIEMIEWVSADRWIK